MTTIMTTFAGKTFHFSSAITAIKFAVNWTKMMSEAGIINDSNLKCALKSGACRLFTSH